MGTMVETDMDQFIRNHKLKVQQERNELDERVSYPAGPPITSPSTRKQWDRGRAAENIPAEESRRAQQQPTDRGLIGNDSVQEQKKRQLQIERQKEYNELINKKGPASRRRPRTPAHEGLPLGQYSEKKKALERERNEEMKAAMAKPDMTFGKVKGDVFDYEATKKSMMEEKRKEYNQYLEQMKNRRGRHIVTPEHGMFVGEDQRDRDKHFRDRNLKYKHALEQQWMDQLAHKALLEGEVAEVTPRSISDSPRKILPVRAFVEPKAQVINPMSSETRTDVHKQPDIHRLEPIVPALKLADDTNYVVEERVMDMPKVTPRLIPQPEESQQKPVAAKPKQQSHSSVPINHQGRRMRRIFGLDTSTEAVEGLEAERRNELDRDYERGRDLVRGRRGISDRDHPQGRSRSYEAETPHHFGEGLEKYQWSRPGPRSPLKDVRRSRSLSPIRDRHPVNLEDRKRELQRILEEIDQTVPTGRYYIETPPPPANPYPGENDPNSVHVYLDQSPRSVRQEIAQRNYYEQMAEKQQVLKQEYEREVAEAQRLANEQGNTFEQQEYQNKHRQLEEEKKREYQEYLAENPKKSLRRKEVTPEDLRRGLPLDQSKYDIKRQQLLTARKQEYNELLQKNSSYPHWNSPFEETFLDNFGKVDPMKEILLEERKREYRELFKQQRAQRRDMPEGTGATLPVGEYTDTRKQQLYNERQKEYQEHQQQKQATERRRGLPPKPPTPNHFFKNLGQHDRQINALNEERKKEYNQKLTDNVYRGRGRTAANAQGNAGSLPIGGTGSAEESKGDTYATLPGLHYSESPEIRKMKVRNDEYNEFLREKLQKDAHRLDHKKPPGRHSEPNSPRNRQTGWSTPTYEEILEQKRREEAIRRHAEEGVPGLRSFHSEGALNRLEDNLRARELDKEFETRKVRFDDERKFANGILEDDNWLNPERREEQYQNLTEPPPPLREPEMTAVRQPYNATLLVGGVPGAGHDETGSAKRRKQADYARELQFQMKEAQAARTREKRHGLPVNASGWIDPEKTSDRVKGIGGDQITSPRREYKANSVQPYHTKFLVDDRDDYDALGRTATDFRSARLAPPRTNVGGFGPGIGLGSIITSSILFIFQAKSTQHEKIIELLFVLPRRGPKAFPAFLDAVKKHSQFLSDKLQMDYEKEYKIMKEQAEELAAVAAEAAKSKEDQSHQLDISDATNEHHNNTEKPLPPSPERANHNSASKFQNDSPRRMSVSNTNHVMTSSIIQQNLNTLYTRLKTKIQSSKHKEPSFSSPEPATFKMVDKLIDEVFQLLEEHEMTFSQCHALLGGRDRTYPLASHIINMQKTRRELEQDLKAKEQQKNKYADHISKLENRCRNQATEINHLNDEVKKLKVEIEKLEQINSEREEKQKIIDELRKMVMDADTTKKSKLRSSYLALHYDGNVSEIKQLRNEVRNLKIENQSLKTDNLMLKKSENLKKLQKMREDANPKSDNTNDNVNHQNSDIAKETQKTKSRHVYAQSLQSMQAQARGGNSKWVENSDKSNYLFQHAVEKSHKGSIEHLAVTSDNDEKPKVSKPREKDPQELDFRFSNSQNGLYGQKRSPSKERSNKRVTFSSDDSAAKDSVVVIPTGQDTDDVNQEEKISGKNTNNLFRNKPDKNSRGRPPRQNQLKNKSSNKRSASLNSLQGSRDLVKMSSQLIHKSRTLRTQNGQDVQASPLLSDIGDGLQYSLGGTGVERGRRRERDLDILDPGITGLLQQRRAVGPVNPPQQLMYQPSYPELQLDVPTANPLTFVTAGAGGIGGPYSSIDEAYHYYGMKNPLDVGDVGGGVPALNLGGDFGGRRGSPTRVTFREPESPVTAHRKRDRSKERISPYQFPSDDDNRSRSRQDTLSYGAELERQIAEKRMQKQLQREEQERYERRLEEDIKNYNPFGRSGGGAPVKDSSGNPIADLRSLQRGNLSDRQSPVRQVPPEGSPQPPAPRDDYIQPPPVQHNALGESTYARGGHGIFGPPKTDAEKTASDRYKEELRQQIEDKKRKSLQAKELERQEEERENKRLEEQRQRMQAEYEKEQREKKEREEETRRKNEELRKLAEDKKKESERKKREAEDARMREQQEQIEKEKQEKQREAQNDGVKSPPVPAIKVKNEQRTNSPPLPAHRRDRESPRPVSRGSRTSSRAQPSPRPGPSNTRPNSSDVLTQLASMRKQLQNERQRVENALENSKNEPDVFDPRMVQRPTQSNKLVFENAMNKNASLPPPRAQTSDMANARNIQQFNELKFKSDSDSRRAFRSMFPDAPVTNMTLEAQQDAMIRQQEEALRGMRERIGDDILVKIQSEPTNVSEDPYDNSTSLGYGRHGNTSARSQLAANSAFIDVEGVNHFPDDFEDLPGVRNDSARARRRDRFSPRVPSVNGMGSQTSLDVDRIERKNAERLRRLHQQINTGDDVSVGDPDDILDRFMAKQRYNRPPSGQTLQDDTWLRPGSKAI